MKRLLIIVGCLMTLAIVATAQQSPQARWASIDGHKIKYFDIGNRKAKNALVLVHCWTCNVEFWKDTYNAFPGYRVIALDLPGHGDSDKPKIDYSIEFFARSVDAVIKQAGVKKAVFAGHSMGTPVIRKYYELYPTKTLGLVVVDGSLIPYANRAELEKFFEPFYKDYKNEAPKFVDGMLPKDRTLAAHIKSTMLATPEHVATSAMRLMTDDSYAEHGKIDVPVLALMAPSAFWPADLEAKYRSMMPKIEYQMWPGTSHFLHMEQPARFNGQVKGWIMRNGLL